MEARKEVSTGKATGPTLKPAAVAATADEEVSLLCYGNGTFAPGRNTTDVPNPTIVGEKQLNEIIKNNTKLTRPNWRPALYQLGGSSALLVFSAWLLTVSPWFFLPVAWALAGLALSQFFIIGHDCAHGTWCPDASYNDLIGEFVFLFLLQPFHAFKLAHESGEEKIALKASKLSSSKIAPDTVDGEEKNPVVLAIGYASEENTEPLPWWMQQALEFLRSGFLPNMVGLSSEKKNKIYTGIALQLAYLALVLPIIFAKAGAVGLLTMWVMPLLSYHVIYAALVRVYSLNVRAVLPRSASNTFKIASYNYPAFVTALERSKEVGESIRESSLVALAKAWYPRIHWLNLFILTFTPIISMVGMFTTPVQRPTLYFSIFYYFFTGLGITAGYHRLFAHRAYNASTFTKYLMMLMGSGALEGSIKWWCGGHRVHHRYTDTPKDPYNSHGGFWYAHIGWMLIKPDPRHHTKADIRDLTSDPVIRFQHKYYLVVGPFMAFVLPTLVAGLLWGDWMGGYFYAGALRLCFVHHSTFCVNSVAHYFGSHSYDDDRTPRDSVVTAVLTLGEGYHNFHHEFPNDYRNGIQWYHYDPTKWFIALLSYMGLTYNLKVFPKNEVNRGILYMKQKQLQQLQSKIVVPKDATALPKWSWEEYQRRVKDEGQNLVLLDGFIHDVSTFLPTHPGGMTILRGYLGKDASNVFHGRTEPVVYKHSHAAQNLVSQMRVATIDATTMPQGKKEE